MTNIRNGGSISKGFALITKTPIPSNNSKIKDGGVEIVENGGSSIGSTVEKGGIQIVTRAGTAINTKVSGGKQFVFEEKSFVNLKNMEKSSSVYDSIVSGVDGAVG
ncbi:AIDA repeat-containing protein [Bartonella alsatica]|uniref:Uncharacterized protein n=1 Tax=Bartonella alsatica IBS 382 TaxID=1094551 RepID=J0YKU6_9HYPH|nr:AIDA repeat-containing protein [Bartonella alsatica]EJF75178.1 hypothetical protein MEC_00654 [Bartonella alsatica IBS 382]